MTRKSGWIPDKHDHRDFLFSSIATKSIDQIPKQIDMRNFMTPVETQGDLHACVACALVGALEYLYVYKILNRWSCLKPRDYSRLFVYWYARVEDNIQDIDGGCHIRSAVKAVQDIGICRENTWSYETSKCNIEPNEDAKNEAKSKTIHDYYRINDYNELLLALSQNLPVVFGATLYSSFDDVGINGIVNMPSDIEISTGGHSMLACGYDLDKQIIIVRNSWGSQWGDKGYCYMPLAYFDIKNRVQDCWVIRNGPDN